MMCFVNSGGGAQQTAEPGQIQKPASSVDPVVQQARAAAQRKSRASSGAKSTILTRAAVVAGERKSLIPGITLGAPAANKTLLGA